MYLTRLTNQRPCFVRDYVHTPVLAFEADKSGRRPENPGKIGIKCSVKNCVTVSRVWKVYGPGMVGKVITENGGRYFLMEEKRMSQIWEERKKVLCCECDVDVEKWGE